jgi:hypothetical protein
VEVGAHLLLLLLLQARSLLHGQRRRCCRCRCCHCRPRRLLACWQRSQLAHAAAEVAEGKLQVTQCHWPPPLQLLLLLRLLLLPRPAA